MSSPTAPGAPSPPGGKTHHSGFIFSVSSSSSWSCCYRLRVPPRGEASRGRAVSRRCCFARFPADTRLATRRWGAGDRGSFLQQFQLSLWIRSLIQSREAWMALSSSPASISFTKMLYLFCETLLLCYCSLLQRFYICRPSFFHPICDSF